MKKYYYFFLLLSTSYCYSADTVTVGRVGLLKPATGVIDTTRGWGDKSNSNLDIMAASITTCFSLAENIFSTQIVNGQVMGIDIAAGTVGGTQTIRGILDGVLSNNIGILFASHTLSSNAGGLVQNNIGILFSSHTVSGNAGGLVQNNTGVISSTMTNLLSSTHTWTSSQVWIDSVTFSSGTIGIAGNRYFFQSSAPVTGDSILHHNEGRIFLGGDSGGDGTGVDGSTVGIREYTMVVGTPGAQNVQGFVSDANSYNLLLASVGARGLTNSTTAQATFFFRNGTYVIPGTTNPAGITVVFDSSATWVLDNASQTLVNNYGRLVNPRFDLSGLGIRGKAIVSRTNSIIENATIVGANNISTTKDGAAIFYVNDSSNVLVDGLWFKEWRPYQGENDSADGGAFYIRNSSNSRFYNLRFSSALPQTVGVIQQGMAIEGCNDIHFYNLIAEAAGTNFINVNDNNFDIFFHEPNIVVAEGGAGNSANYGVFTFETDGAGSDISTMTFINNGTFVIRDRGTAVFISGRDPGSSGNIHFVVTNCTVIAPDSNSWTFIRVASNNRKCVIQNNHAYRINTFLSDSGVGTINSQNRLNGVLQ